MPMKAEFFCLALGCALLFGGLGCDADPAEVLDEPRFLAVQAAPPQLVAGQTVTLTALTFAMEDGLRWQWCPSNWVSPPLDAADDALVCSAGDPVSLGVGPTATLEPPADLDSLWVLVEAPTGVDALPAVRLLEATGGDSNPTVLEITQLGPQPPPAIRVGDAITLTVSFGPDSAPEAHVATWYVTAGELLPERTVGAELVTLTAPSDPGTVEVIVVVRDTKGGVSWLTRTFAVTQ